MSNLKFNVTPAEFLRELQLEFKKKGAWLSPRYCLFCDGGQHRDKYSLSVHEKDGNFFCHRAKCGERGSFWKFIESQNKNPCDYIDKSGFRAKKKQAKSGYKQQAWRRW